MSMLAALRRMMEACASLSNMALITFLNKIVTSRLDSLCKEKEFCRYSVEPERPLQSYRP